MEKSDERLARIEAALATFRPQPPDLEFPIAPEFISKPPRLPWRVIYERSLERLHLKTSQPDFHERRAAEKIDVEFVL
jgi:hypothetical protein